MLNPSHQSDRDILAAIGIRYESDIIAPAAYSVEIYLDDLTCKLKYPTRRQCSHMTDGEYERMLSDITRAKEHFATPIVYTTSRPPSHWTERDFANLVECMGRQMEDFPLAYTPKCHNQAYGRGWMWMQMTRDPVTGSTKVLINVTAAHSVRLEAEIKDINEAAVALWLMAHPPLDVGREASSGKTKVVADYRPPKAQREYDDRVAAERELRGLIKRLGEDGSGAET